MFYPKRKNLFFSKKKKKKSCEWCGIFMMWRGKGQRHVSMHVIQLFCNRSRGRHKKAGYPASCRPRSQKMLPEDQQTKMSHSLTLILTLTQSNSNSISHPKTPFLSLSQFQIRIPIPFASTQPWALPKLNYATSSSSSTSLRFHCHQSFSDHFSYVQQRFSFLHWTFSCLRNEVNYTVYASEFFFFTRWLRLHFFENYESEF